MQKDGHLDRCSPKPQEIFVTHLRNLFELILENWLVLGGCGSHRSQANRNLTRLAFGAALSG
eukprot:4820216-Amphidinium_carterae.1